MSSPKNEFSCLNALDTDSFLRHKRLGHVSYSMLNKLITKDLVLGLPRSKFMEDKVCNACVKGKQVISSFKSKKLVSTSRPLELFHMDLCEPIRIQSRGGKRYVFIIFYDYFRFTWTIFLETKDEIFNIFVIVVKKLQRKINSHIASIRSHHETELKMPTSLSSMPEMV